MGERVWDTLENKKSNAEFWRPVYRKYHIRLFQPMHSNPV
jgi:hypothetical protein